MTVYYLSGLSIVAGLAILGFVWMVPKFRK